MPPASIELVLVEHEELARCAAMGPSPSGLMPAHRGMIDSAHLPSALGQLLALLLLGAGNLVVARGRNRSGPGFDRQSKPWFVTRAQ
ncbi:MAG: hypothetical protein JRH01_18155 [Deltaproteobacteria bacterium]|nr:hypothetical protein [Deltaproteobacteria bacterium]